MRGPEGLVRIQDHRVRSGGVRGRALLHGLDLRGELGEANARFLQLPLQLVHPPIQLRETRVRAGPGRLNLLPRGRDLRLQGGDPLLLLRLKGEETIERAGRRAVIARRGASRGRDEEREQQEEGPPRHFETTCARRFLDQESSSCPVSNGRSLPYEIVVSRFVGMP